MIMTKNEPFSEQLRRAIRESELSRYEIWKRTGVAQSVLSRFLNDPSVGLSLDAVDRLTDCLGLKLVAEKPAKKRKTEG